MTSIHFQIIFYFQINLGYSADVVGVISIFIQNLQTLRCCSQTLPLQMLTEANMIGPLALRSKA